MSVREARPAPKPTAATGVAITAVGLCKTIKGGRQVLHDVSFAVRPGELVAIVGGSGAGKTMLLEALAGVRPAERGEVRFDGVDLYANLDAFRSGRSSPWMSSRRSRANSGRATGRSSSSLRRQGFARGNGSRLSIGTSIGSNVFSTSIARTGTVASNGRRPQQASVPCRCKRSRCQRSSGCRRTGSRRWCFRHGLVLPAFVRVDGGARVREHWPGPERLLEFVMRAAGMRTRSKGQSIGH